ncbi:phenylalanine--tRNA ligase subunit alpha [Micromonospora sp. DT43]|uniref:phenylalanine--tRNA ligase subunit alpha n=1 Tax=Micromonospora sp. DT43 TaxID=3393440 RepID=UPI003CEB9DCD
MTADTDALREALLHELAEAREPDEVERVRVKFLGQKDGSITTLIRGTNFGALDKDERRVVGNELSGLKSFAETAIRDARQQVEAVAARQRRRGLVDLTLPGERVNVGSINPVNTIQLFLEDVFRGMGFMVEQGFEVETEYYNFDALNVARDHPARDMQDTFWLDSGALLRTHTSATQVRAMRKYGTPLRAIFPGRCFRYEALDASHETSFYQCEGLMVDRGVTVANLLSVMQTLLRQVFERDVSVRLRPGYFPFVEPGFELDLSCLICSGEGCRVCKHSGWVELMPCGMVHPRVLEAAGVDPETHSGFAFGLGMTRLAMLKYGIPDIRLFDSGDWRFYRQFPATV